MGRMGTSVAHFKSKQNIIHHKLTMAMEYGKRARANMLGTNNYNLYVFGERDVANIFMVRKVSCSRLSRWSPSYDFLLIAYALKQISSAMNSTKPNGTKQNQIKPNITKLKHTAQAVARIPSSRAALTKLSAYSTSTIFLNKIHTYIIKYVYIALCMTVVI